MKNRKHSLLLLTILLAACSPQLQTTEAEESFATPVSIEESADTYLRETQAAEFGDDEEAEAAPTEDTRLLPQDWQEWPVIPEVTNNARAIYTQGITMGNNPHAFSKVADCQNVSNAFLGFFDHPGKYDQIEGVEELQDTIDNFSGYFDRDGQATQYGFNAAAVLSPLWADTEVCLPDENPLECELRITRPTFVLISLEFWFEGRTPDVYERYMRQIIEYTIAQGAVPILATTGSGNPHQSGWNRCRVLSAG